MILDFREYDGPDVLEADLCIVGAGAAGISLAREFVGHPFDVCLVESGGFELEAEVQALYQGESVGIPVPLQASRLRYFGGTTGHWGGWCMALTDADFRARPWVPHSGWPIDSADLADYYARAQVTCELGQVVLDDDVWKGLGVDASGWQPRKLVDRFWQRSAPTRFGAAYREELERAPNVRVLLHANLTELATASDAGRVTGAVIQSFAGRRAVVRARRYVLACGAIENARNLLLSDRVARAGLGNQHDRVGRFFLAHPACPGGHIVTNRPDALRGRTRWLAYPSRPAGKPTTNVRPGIFLAEVLQESEGVLNCVIGFSEIEAPKGVRAARRALAALREGRLPENLSGTIRQIAGDFDEVLPALYRDWSEGEKAKFKVSFTCEQEPDPASRITLSGERDALGLRRVRVDWRVNDRFHRTATIALRTLGAELGRLELGRLHVAEWFQPELGVDTPVLVGWDHQMGTTRMSANPKEGVVDVNCRVHGVANLYVAGGSVFPTSGVTSPTFTLVALALRLADHLKSTA